MKAKPKSSDVVRALWGLSLERFARGRREKRERVCRWAADDDGRCDTIGPAPNPHEPAGPLTTLTRSRRSPRCPAH